MPSDAADMRAWLPIRLIFAIFGGGGGSSAVAIGGGGAGGTNVRVGSNNKAPLIVGAVFLGMVLLQDGVQHPWLFILLFLLGGAGGFVVWKQKTAKDAPELELREQYRRDVIANRADYKDELWHEGDPRGTSGRYPPARRRRA